jgi:4-amino-4-deoxy-L-arabinose transferase-like glycosyltransferase
MQTSTNAVTTLKRRSARDVKARVILAVVLLVAAAVRVLGTQFGLPLLLHPDEFAVVDAAVDMARRNSFQPPWSYRPDHVEMKIDLVLFEAYAALKGTSVGAAFAADPAPFYHLARLVTAAFGVAGVGLAYLIGARWSRRVGLVAAALFAVFPPYVQHAHFATPDVPLTFALLLLIYALMRYVDSTSWSSLLVASFAVALAVGIKYPGAVGALMIAIIVVSTAVRDHDLRRLVMHGVASAVAAAAFLFAISPLLFTSFGDIRREIKVQAAGDRLGHPDHGLWGNLWFYADQFLLSSGIVLSLLAVVGLVVVVRARRLDTVPWFSGLLVWGLLSTLPMTWERWGLPMWVTPLLLASVGICALLDRLATSRARWVAVTAVGALALHLCLGTIWTVSSLVADDTRQASLAWARQQRITASESTYEGYTPFLPGTSYLFFTSQVTKARDGYKFRTITGEPARYVVLSSGMYERVQADPTYAPQQAIYDYITENFEEIATFESGVAVAPSMWEPVSVPRLVSGIAEVWRGALSGPTIRIFEIPPERVAAR